MGAQEPIAKQFEGVPYKPPKPSYIPIYKRRGDPDSGVLCLFDYQRGIVSIHSRGVNYPIDLGAEIVAHLEKLAK